MRKAKKTYVERVIAEDGIVKLVLHLDTGETVPFVADIQFESEKAAEEMAGKIREGL